MLQVAMMDTLSFASCGRPANKSPSPSPSPLKRSKSTRRAHSLEEPLVTSFIRRWSFRSKRRGAFLNESQEWTLPRASFDLRLTVVGNPSSGKTLVIHRYLNGLSKAYDPSKIGKYDQFKQDVLVDGKNRLLLIRDVTGTPSPQVIKWADAFLLVFNVCDESSFHMALTYYDKICQEKRIQDVPIILVGTQDAITDSKPRRVSSMDVRRVTTDSKEPLQCPYMEANAKHGVNVDYIFKEICRKMVLARRNASQLLSSLKSGSPMSSGGRSLSGDNLGSSPQSVRKSKRKSTLFPSGSGSKIASAVEKMAAFGKGRSVPVKQGDLLKKSKSGLSKEWKKKFVTLTEGKLTYYSSLQDYMHDVHGKEINLQRSTVKVPGFRPATAAAVATDGIRPIKSASSTDIQNYYHSHDFRQVDHGSVEGIGELAIAAAAMALQKSLEHDISKDDKLSSKKVWGHETEGNASPPDASTPRLLSINRRVSEVNLPVARERETDSPRRSTLPLVDKTDELDGKKREKSGSIDSVSRSSSMSRSHRDAPAVSTPGGLSTHKKGHRRRRSWGTPKMLEDGLELFSENCEFDIVSLDGRSWQFQAANQEEMESWVKAIRQQIQVSLQMGTSDKAKLHPGTHAVDRQEINGIREIEGNDFCADCNSPNPQWVSLNLGAVVCINCSGIHRKLGTHLSRIKSLELDDWSPEQLAAVKAIGNTMSRRVYEATVTGNYTRPTYTSSRDDREAWIRAKYDAKDFLEPLPESEFPIGQILLAAVYNEDIERVFESIAYCTPDDVNERYGKDDGRTALHVACTVGNIVLLQFLIWAGGDVNAEDADGFTPIVYARAANHQDCVDLLLQNGCRDDPLPPSEAPIFVTEEGVVLDQLEASII